MARILALFVLLATILAPYSTEPRIAAQSAAHSGSNGERGHGPPLAPSVLETEDSELEELAESEGSALREVVGQARYGQSQHLRAGRVIARTVFGAAVIRSRGPPAFG